MSLTTQSRGLWWLFGLACVALATYTLAYWVDIEREETLQQRSLAAHVSELDRQITQLSFVPKLLADDASVIGVVNTASTANVKAANRRLQQAQQESGLDVAYVMAADGMTIAASNWQEPSTFIGSNYSFRPYFKGAMAGSTTTFFALGATTGVPGYFIGEPIYIDGNILGVVVAKMSLNAPVDTWKALDFESVVVDEFGVIILSSDERMLYSPTRTILPGDLSRIERERRYPLQPAGDGSHQQNLEKFRWYTKDLLSEPWRFTALVPRKSHHIRALFVTVVLSALCCLGYLLQRNYRQQKVLIASEQRLSRELEDQVANRTLELERAQDALIAESNYAILGRMSAAINHEINQPLTSLRLNLASLRKLVESPGNHADEIEQIAVESDRTTKRIGLVIESLRNYTRKDQMRVESVAVAKLMDDVVGVIRSERPTMSQCLKVRDHNAEYMVTGDRVLLQQALLNLLYNALDSVIHVDHPEVMLSILSHAEQPHVSISVTDNGGGLADELVPNLFEPFTTSRGEQGGLGLGLTIAKQIAESHKGSLLYSSEPDGCTFSLNLPVADQRQVNPEYGA